MDTPLVPTVVPEHSPRPASNDKLLAILCHLSAFLGVPLLLPLIVYLVAKEDSPFVRNQARETLNFHLSLCFYTLICAPLVLIAIGIPLMMAIGVFGVVVAIIAAVKVGDGVSYRYPLCIRLIR